MSIGAGVSRVSLARKLYGTLVPLVLTGITVTLMAWTSLRNNVAPLLHAKEVKELAVTSLSLLLTEDDATKAMILDPENATTGRRKIHAYDANLVVLKKLEGLSRSAEMSTLLKSMANIEEKELRDIDTAVLEALGDGKLEAAKRLYFQKYEPARSRYEALVRRLCEVAETESAAAALQLERNNGRSLRNISMSLFACLLCVGVPLIYLARIVDKRLGSTVVRLEKEALSSADSSSLLTQSSQALLTQAACTAQSLDETSVSIHNIAARTKANTEHARTAAELSSTAAARTDSAAEGIARMVASMSEIKASSAGISKIIRVIDEIAFQTNILALNAAVEAARAGQAGLGFSVVADEVRRLARRSAAAAGETTQLIESAVVKSQQGFEICTSVALELNRVIEQTRRTGTLVEGIAAASLQQSAEIDQVTAAVSHLQRLTNATAGQAEKSSVAALELRSQSESVREVVRELMTLVGSGPKAGSAEPEDCLDNAGFQASSP